MSASSIGEGVVITSYPLALMPFVTGPSAVGSSHQSQMSGASSPLRWSTIFASGLSSSVTNSRSISLILSRSNASRTGELRHILVMTYHFVIRVNAV